MDNAAAPFQALQSRHVNVQSATESMPETGLLLFLMGVAAVVFWSVGHVGCPLLHVAVRRPAISHLPCKRSPRAARWWRRRRRLLRVPGLFVLLRRFWLLVMLAVMRPGRHFVTVMMWWPRYARGGAGAEKSRHCDIKQILIHNHTGFVSMTHTYLRGLTYPFLSIDFSLFGSVCGALGPLFSHF